MAPEGREREPSLHTMSPKSQESISKLVEDRAADGEYGSNAAGSGGNAEGDKVSGSSLMTTYNKVKVDTDDITKSKESDESVISNETMVKDDTITGINENAVCNKTNSDNVTTSGNNEPTVSNRYIAACADSGNITVNTVHVVERCSHGNGSTVKGKDIGVDGGNNKHVYQTSKDEADIFWDGEKDGLFEAGALHINGSPPTQRNKEFANDSNDSDIPASVAALVRDSPRMQPVQGFGSGRPTSGTSVSTMGTLSKLPGELRNRIYKLCLVAPNGIFVVGMQPKTCSHGPCTHTKMSTAFPSLLSACRLIRIEALPMFCSRNTFKFTAIVVRHRCVANWLRVLGPYGRLISLIILEIMVLRRRLRSPHDQIFRTYEIRIELPAVVPSMVAKTYEIKFSKYLVSRDAYACERLRQHLQDLSSMSRRVTLERVLLAFIWSDILAEYIWDFST